MSESSTLIINTESRFSNFDEVSPASRSMYIRTFGKMDSGALRGAIFTLCSTAIGAGCLALPSIFHKQGIFLAASLLIFACYISYLGIVNISHAAETFQVYEYSSLVEKVLGPKSKILLDTALLVGQFGTLTGYQIIIGEFVPQVFKSLDIEFDKDMLRYIIMISSNLLIITPLALKKTLTSLRFMSIISMLTIIYIALLIIIEFPYYAKDNVYENNIEWFRFDLSIISSLNVCFYSFSCHINVAQVYDELNNRNLRRMSKVAFRALTGVLLPFILMATFGYLSTLNNTPNLFISREAPRDISNDWLMVTARILMSITLIIAVAINIPSTRIIVIKSLFRVKKNPSTFIHCLATFGLLWITLLVAIFYPEIMVIFSVCGGFCCGVVTTLLPSKDYLGLLKIKTENYEKNSLKLLLYKFGSIFLFLLGTTGAILSTAGLA